MELLDKDLADLTEEDLRIMFTTYTMIPKDPPLCERCGSDLGQWRNNNGKTHGGTKYCSDCREMADKELKSIRAEIAKMKRAKDRKGKCIVCGKVKALKSGVCDYCRVDTTLEKQRASVDENNRRLKCKS